MANMGVRASLSLPVVGANTLVALVVAHHAAPRALPTGILEQLAARTRAFALASLGFESRRRIRLVDGLSSHFRDFDDLRRRQGDFVTAWGDFAPSLLKTFEADGIALVIDGTSLFFGPRPLEPEALAVLDDWFSRHEREQVWYSDSLSRQLPEYPLSATAGALALRASTRRGPVRVYFNRLEHVHEVAWGGNPNKPFETVDGGLQVSPRRSFEKWVEKRLGYSRPWGNECKLLALALRQLLV